MATPVTLRVYDGDQLVVTREFHRDIIKIGRLSSAHLCLTDDKVSRIHAVIEVGGDGSVSIIDMGSVDGTYVNGRRVNKGPLTSGDEIRVGRTLIRVDIGEAAARAAQEGASAARSAAPAPVAVAPVQPAAPQPVAPQAVAPQASASQAPVQAAPAAAARPQRVHAAPAGEPAARAAPATDDGFLPISAWWTEDTGWPRWEAMPPPPQPLAADVAGPLTLDVRFYWGNQQLGAAVFEDESAVTVGPSEKADFHLEGDRLPEGEDFQLLRKVDGQWHLAFTAAMEGEVIHDGVAESLQELARARKARPSGQAGAMELALSPDMAAWVDLGHIRADVCFRPKPRSMVAPLLERLDYQYMQLLATVIFLALGGIVAVNSYSQDVDVVADDLFSNQARFTKLLLKPPERQRSAFLEKLQAETLQRPEAAQGDAGQAGSPTVKPQPRPARAATKAIDPNDKETVKRKGILALLGSGNAAGLSTIFGKSGLGGELQGALGGLTGNNVGDAHGLGGLALKGAGLGGGGVGTTIGVGDVGTKGRGGGIGDYGAGAGGLGNKGSADVNIDATDAVIMGSLDKELIRRVIQSHRAQIRYCYESELVRQPKLKGKIAVRFVITGNGTVSTATTASTTMNNAAVESCLNARVKSWLFPKPKGGGIVIVTYPFVFTRPGG